MLASLAIGLLLILLLATYGKKLRSPSRGQKPRL